MSRPASISRSPPILLGVRKHSLSTKSVRPAWRSPMWPQVERQNLSPPPKPAVQCARPRSVLVPQRWRARGGADRKAGGMRPSLTVAEAGNRRGRVGAEAPKASAMWRAPGGYFSSLGARAPRKRQVRVTGLRRRRAGPRSQGEGQRGLASPWRLPALHSSPRGRQEKRDRAAPAPSKIRAAERWLSGCHRRAAAAA